MDVHRAALGPAAGHAGQVVLSEATRRLVTVEPLRDLGVHRLKDVGELRLYQLGDGEFPPIQSLRRGNVGDGARTPIGRDRELRELTSILVDDRARLVTLTGPGGIGKTTLALALAGALDRYVDGRWFVDLSSVQELALVELHVAVTIGAPGDVLTFLAAHAGAPGARQPRACAGRRADLGVAASGPGLTVLATSGPRCSLYGRDGVPRGPAAHEDRVELLAGACAAVDPTSTSPTRTGDLTRGSTVCRSRSSSLRRGQPPHP